MLKQKLPNCKFYTVNSNSNTEKLRIQAGGGISFNGDTAAANALDDYEEGTWTPTLASDAGPGGYTAGLRALLPQQMIIIMIMIIITIIIIIIIRYIYKV